MNMHIHTILKNFTVFCASLAWTCPIWSQNAPPPCCPGPACPNGETVKILVAFPAGGVQDTLARLLRDELGKTTNTTYIVENFPGGGGIYGAERAVLEDWKKTIFIGGSELLINASLHTTTRYQMGGNLHPAALIGNVSNLLVAHPSLGVKNLDELATVSVSRNLRLGYLGVGSANHLLAKQLLDASKVKIAFSAPFMGTEALSRDLQAGQVELAILPRATFQTIPSGNLRAIAVIGQKPIPTLGAVQTTEQVGLGSKVVAPWIGAFAVGDSTPICTRSLGIAIINAMCSENARTRMDSLGIDVIERQDNLEAQMRTDAARWKTTLQQERLVSN